MNITLFVPSSEGYGTFFRCFFLGKYLTKSGHRVALVCFNREQTLRITRKSVGGVNITTIPFSSSFAKIIPIQFADAIINCLLETSSKSDLVHSFSVINLASATPTIFVRILNTLGLRREKLLVDWDDWWGRGGMFKDFPTAIQIVETLLEEKVPLLGDAVTVVSEVLRQRALKVGIEAEKIFKIPNGADVDSIKPMPKRAAREKLGLPLNKTILCHLGVTDLTQEYENVAKNYPDAILLIVGSLSRYAKFRIPRSKGIVYVGRQPYERVPLFLSASDILLLRQDDVITDWARWPIRFGDHLASGRPTVTTAIGEVARVMREGSCGLLAKPNDWEDFSDKILQLIRSPQLCEEMGRHAREIAERKYSWQIIATELEMVYEHFL